MLFEVTYNIKSICSSIELGIEWVKYWMGFFIVICKINEHFARLLLLFSRHTLFVEK